jgi:hypothetical protein
MRSIDKIKVQLVLWDVFRYDLVGGDSFAFPKSD